MLRFLIPLLAAFVPLAAAAQAQETPDALVKRIADEVLAIVKQDNIAVSDFF